MSPNAFAREAFADVLEKPITRTLEAINPGDTRIVSRRQPGSPYRVRLRAIGSWENPGRYRDLLTEQATARAQVETRARAALVAAGRLDALTREDADTAIARLAVEVEAVVNEDAGLRELAGRNNRLILVEGVEGGEAEVERLYRLGGGRLLNQVMDEIHGYHVLDHEAGEG